MISTRVDSEPGGLPALGSYTFDALQSEPRPAEQDAPEPAHPSASEANPLPPVGYFVTAPCAGAATAAATATATAATRLLWRTPSSSCVDLPVRRAFIDAARVTLYPPFGVDRVNWTLRYGVIR